MNINLKYCMGVYRVEENERNIFNQKELKLHTETRKKHTHLGYIHLYYYCILK